MIDNILNKDFTKLTFKERQLVVDYFRYLVNKEFEKFKEIFLKKDKTEIFERAYLIDTYDNIRIRLIGLNFFTSIFVGILGIPGAILLIILQLII